MEFFYEFTVNSNVYLVKAKSTKRMRLTKTDFPQEFMNFVFFRENNWTFQ